MEKAYIIVNPVSGNEKGLTYAGRLVSRLTSFFDEVIVTETRVGEGAEALARRAAEAGAASVFAIGGDGTVNEVITGLTRAKVSHLPILGVIPAGTFNGVARILNFPTRPQDAIDSLDLNRIENLDIGLCNERAFSFVFSIGDIPESIHRVSPEAKTTFGMWAYVTHMVSKSAEDTTYNLELEIDGKVIKGSYSHLVVLLSGSLNNLKIVSEATKDDGWLHIFLLKESNFWEKFSVLKEIFLGNPTDHRQVEYYKGKCVHISSPDEGIETDVEGERGADLPVELKLLPTHLRAYTLDEQSLDRLPMGETDSEAGR